MQDKRYPKSCYKMFKSLDETGRQNWASKVRVLLYTYGFGYVWISQDIEDIGLFITQFKVRLIDCMTQKWHSNIIESTRRDTYREFKPQLNIETYLCIDMPFYLRKAFARFRCSSHKLNIELGRHRGIARADRICLQCFNQLNRLVKKMSIMYFSFVLNLMAYVKSTYNVPGIDLVIVKTTSLIS